MTKTDITFFLKYAEYSTPVLKANTMICDDEYCGDCKIYDYCSSSESVNNALSEQDLTDLENLFPEYFV